MSDRPMTRGGAAARALVAVAPRPGLWRVALGTAVRLVPSGWWRRAPFLPVPDAAYWSFRMQTAFGTDTKGRPSRRDIVDYLRWCQRTRSWRR